MNTIISLSIIRDEIMESIHHDKMMNTSQDYFNEMVEQKVNELIIAAMRCYEASKLGDDVEIPKELL